MIDEAAVDDTSSPESFDRRRQAAEYIAAMAAELAEMARAQKLHLLAHLLDMARQEAHELVHQGLTQAPGPDGRGP
ncbi:MAG TPA: hypothetical protein VLA00_00075 [Xanthobacteraceae bacterium]|nr:hypothetical protein [Xanthobacteraceae bacterium]